MALSLRVAALCAVWAAVLAQPQRPGAVGSGAGGASGGAPFEVKIGQDVHDIGVASTDVSAPQAEAVKRGADDGNAESLYFLGLLRLYGKVGATRSASAPRAREENESALAFFLGSGVRNPLHRSRSFLRHICAARRARRRAVCAARAAGRRRARREGGGRRVPALGGARPVTRAVFYNACPVGNVMCTVSSR